MSGPGTLRLSRPVPLRPELATEPTAPPPPNKAARRRTANREIECILKSLAPAAFSSPPKPLRIGVHADLIALFAGEIEPRDIGRFLRWWCGRTGYLLAIHYGESRVELDGFPSGAPTKAQQEIARQQLAARGIEP